MVVLAELGPCKQPQILEMVLPDGQHHWSKEDIVKFLEEMENNPLFNDSHAFKTTQSLMDWEKVDF